MDRVPAGRVNGVHAPVGTILGPKAVTREFVVVTSNDDRGVVVGFATSEDMQVNPELDPHSMTEFQALMGFQLEHRVRLQVLFGKPS